MTLAAGDNFTIELEDSAAVCRLFKRGDLEPAQISAGYDAFGKSARALALRDGITGLVIDVRRIPGAVGPRVETMYAEVARAWEATGQPLAFLVLDDPIQKLQIVRVTTEAAPRFGAVFTDRNDARAWVGAEHADPNTISKLHDRPSRVHRR